MVDRHEIFLEFRNFPDLRGHSRRNPRSGLIFMGGYHKLCVLAGRLYYPHCQPILNAESSQVSGVCTTSTCTSIT